jgi:tyrosine-specific transport protein
LFAATPVFLHIFNYHFVIPSLRMYAGDKANILKWIIVCGTVMSLIFYMLWAIATLGTVPTTGLNSFESLSQLGHAVDTPDFIKAITTIINNKWATTCINGFYNISMTTSFLGVSLGLFDFLADGFKRANTHSGRLQTAGMTFLPPVIFALFFPSGFIMALNYSSCFIAILCIILPALMVYRLRKNRELKSSYRSSISSKMLIPLAVFGGILFLLPILANLHLLPSVV